MSNNELAYYVAVNETPGIGAVTFDYLWKSLGSAQEIWNLNSSKLAGILKPQQLNRFVEYRKEVDPVSRMTELEQKGVRVAAKYLDGTETYPKQLRQLEHAPAVLYVRGLWDVQMLERCVAVVGTRRPTPYGAHVTAQIARELSEAGVCVVSGLAFGVDATAHRAALAVDGGRTIAVLGSGVLSVTPFEHVGLAEAICKKGAVVSAFVPEQGAHKGHFVARNRLVAALSAGVVVTEGAERSGALITAQFALDMGKKVFVIPGPITSGMNAAPMKLLRGGAMPIASGEEIIKALFGTVTGSKSKRQTLTFSTPGHQKVWELCGGQGKSVDELVLALAKPTALLLGILTELELIGYVTRIRDRFVQTEM